MQLLIVLDSV